MASWHHRAPLRVWAFLWFSVAIVPAVRAANRFVIEDAELAVGSTGNVMPVLMDSDQTILGFSIYLEFDDNDVNITDVALGSAVAGLEPEWFDGSVDNAQGEVSYAVILDFSDPLTKELPAGTGHEILVLTVDVVRGTPGSDTLNLRDDNSVEPRRLNVMTDTNGNSVSPTLDDGAVTIISFAPVITGFANNSGEAGSQFVINGQNFDREGLAVQVCDSAAEFSLLGDGSLLVTAPECGAGPAPVQVCTDFGCDSDPAGFTYPEAPGAPEIQDLQLNSGMAGATFFIVGLGFDQPGLTVEVCNVAAQFTLIGDQIQVTAPACASQGWARVEVCTEFGCDLANQGFFYEGAPPVGQFIRGDTNGDGGTDLSDGVATLNFLFLGGATPGCMDAADANDQGGLDLADAVFTFNFLFLGGNPIPPPVGACGADPTDDRVTCNDYPPCS